MEELENEANKLENVLADSAECGVCGAEADESDVAASKYAVLYKATSIVMDQEKRRKKLLQEMKIRRDQAVNRRRGLIELLSNDDDIEGFEDEEKEFQPEPMDVTKLCKRERRRNIYRYQLMLSEWFREIPSDLESTWLVKLCPLGKRNLIIARNGITRAFDKRGTLLDTFQSHLPGGNRLSSNRRVFTVLDCIYNSALNCYFVLDVIAWHNISFQFSETEFRFFWLKSKLDETPELNEITVSNEHPFIEVESFPAELALIQDKLSHPYRINDKITKLDGVLFYHRATHYVQSYTPLVGWLKPFMVPEMLHVPVDECFMTKMPDNYTSLEQYLKLKLKSRKKRKAHEGCDMEILTEGEMDTQI